MEFGNSLLAVFKSPPDREGDTGSEPHATEQLRPQATDTLETKYCNYCALLLQLMKPGTL